MALARIGGSVHSSTVVHGPPGRSGIGARREGRRALSGALTPGTVRRGMVRVSPLPPDPDRWRAVDRYFADTLVGRDEALDAALVRQADAGLPHIEVAPVNGKFLHLLARIAGARRILEIGTLGGYSTIWLARALPADGRLVTIEADPRHAEVARHNLEAAGVGDRVEVLVGRAADVLATLVGDPFDLVFIDADKQSNALYLDAAARLGRPGTVVVVDNVARGGAVVEADSDDPGVVGTRAALALLGSDPRFDATALQTLDAKGWDGVAVALVTGRPG